MSCMVSAMTTVMVSVMAGAMGSVMVSAMVTVTFIVRVSVMISVIVIAMASVMVRAMVRAKVSIMVSAMAIRHRPCAFLRARLPDKVCDLTHFVSHTKKCRNCHSIVNLRNHFEIHNNNKPFSSMPQSQSIGWV